LIYIKAAKKQSLKVTWLSGGNARERAARDRTKKLLGTYSAPVLAADFRGLDPKPIGGAPTQFVMPGIAGKLSQNQIEALASYLSFVK
jgi:hypothetical protein